MNSRDTAKTRLKKTIFRDRQNISPILSRSVKEEITSLLSEFFSVDEATADMTVEDLSGRKVITYTVEIK